MPVTTTVRDILNSVKSLREFSEIDLNVTLAFKVKRILRKVQTEIDSIVEVRKSIMDKFTEKTEAGEPVHPKDKDGNPIMDQITLTDPKGFEAALTELDKQEVTFSFDQFKEDDLGKSIVIKSSILNNLHWLFTE